ncbi:MAG: secreted agglutinin, partial [Frankiales bacterium]|nr:secreted agglutinin [Frankiales bacterium]
PGTGEALTVNVTNGGTRLVGEAVNYVDIKLPNTAGFSTLAGPLTGPAGWTGSATSIGGIQTYTFRGGSLAPGSSAAFTFPVSVAAPLADRKGALEVAVSSDNGKTTSGAGPAAGLTSTVQTLEIVKDSVVPTSPAGVVDRTGTSTQDIAYALGVKNYARAAQTVTPQLTSTVASDTITQAAALSVPAGGTSTISTPVRLGAAGTRTFSAAATAGSASAADPLTGAAFTVLSPSTLSLDPAGFSPRNSRPGITRDISVPLTKTGTPALNLDTVTLELLLEGGPVLTTADYGKLDVLDNTRKMLTFGNVLLPAGITGLLDARYTFTGNDDNGFPFSYTQTLSKVLKLDATAPIIDRLDVVLPNDADGAQQTALSNDGDTVSITGKLNPADCDATITSLVVKGGSASQSISPIKQTGCDFSGSFTSDKDASTPAITFPAGTTAFSVTATALDPAENPGSAVYTGLVDIVLPTIIQAQTQAANATTSSASRIAVQFNDQSVVLGGCTPSQWKIDSEVLVTQVLFSDGTACSDTTGKADNIRVLVLNQARDQDLQTNVTYTPGTRPFARPAKDGAGQDALARTIATISGVNPAAPVLQTVTRNGGTEPATLDSGAYWTRFTGSDLKVTFLNGRAGYVVRVLDENGAELTRKTIEGSDNSVNVPIGTTDGRYTRQLQLLNGPTLKSALTGFAVELDRVLPKLGTVERVTGQARQVKVTFTEVLAGGTDFAEDWFVSQANAQQDPADPNDDFDYYQVGSVAGSGNARTLTTNSDLAGAGVVDALYNIRNPESVRYADRAGNGVANTGGAR